MISVKAKLRKTDYHVHPDYSIDAAPIKVREYCKQALHLGLEEICFTTHLELDPVRKEIDNFVMYRGKKQPVRQLDWLDGYFEEIHQAQEEFKSSGLKVKAGIEVGYDRGLEEEIEQIVSRYPFDFVMGAIHCIDHIAISSKKESPRYYETHTLQELQQDYFTLLEDAVKSGLFDCMAHVDLYQRYGFQHYGEELLHVHRGVAEPIFREMARRGMGLEINTSSRRRGIQQFHPFPDVIATAKEAGVTVFTVGSDAHSLEDLGSHIEEALELLARYGLTNHVFEQRRAIPLSDREEVTAS